MTSGLVIDQVRLYPVSTGRATGFVSDHVVVEIVSGDLVGWGEMSDIGHLPMYRLDLSRLEADLNGLLAGQDGRRRRLIDERMWRAFPDEPHMYSRSGLVRQGVDLAILDLAGRFLDQPVTQVLGGAVRDRIPVCYPLFRLAPGQSIQAHLDTVDVMHRAGMTRFRLYVGGDIDLEERLLAEIASRHPAVSIKSFDFSNVLSWRAALKWTERLAAILDPELVESPAPRDDFDGLRGFANRGRWPVSEHVVGLAHAAHLVRDARVDVLNVSPYVLGGITGALRVAEFAFVSGVDILIGTTQEMGIGTAAAAVVGALSPSPPYPSDPVGPLLYQDDVLLDPIEYADGNLVVPDGPGLGVQVDRTRLSDLATRPRVSLTASEVFNRRLEVPAP